MNRKLIRSGLTIGFATALMVPMPSQADFANNHLDINDSGADDLTYLRLNNANYTSGGMCYENGDLEWFTDGSCFGDSHEMTLSSSGQLGIGIANPISQLHLASDYPDMAFQDTDNGNVWRLTGNNHFRLWKNGSLIFHIDEQDEKFGFMGLGVSQPEAPLHIYQDSDIQEHFILESANHTNQDRAMMYLSNFGGIRFEFANQELGTAWRFQAATGNEDKFEIAKVGTGAIEMALDAAGNLEIQGTLTEMSDRNAKASFVTLQGNEILERMKQVPVTEWSYKKSPATRHIGPMAQDFHAAFGLGDDETRISPRDLAGVNLAANQAQQDRIEALEARNEDLRTELAELRTVLNQTIAALPTTVTDRAAQVARR